MQYKLFAFVLALIMMLQETAAVDVSLTSKTVVGNILFENVAMQALAVLMLIVAIMI